MRELPEHLRTRVNEARRRLQSHRRWQMWLNFMLPASAVCLAFAVVTRFIYIPGYQVIIAGAMFAFLCVTALLTLKIKVGDFPAAVQLDFGGGLGERVSTAVEVVQKDFDNEIIEALIDDADRAAKGASSRAAIVFQAPMTLPFTLAFAIVTFALVLAPRSFGASKKSLPDKERVALNEAMRLGTSIELLKEAGASEEIVRDMQNAGKELEKRKANEGLKQLKIARARLETESEKALQAEKILDEMKNSPVLEKLGKLLSAGASSEDIKREAGEVAESDNAGTAEVLRDIIKQFKRDSQFLRQLEKALEALEEKEKEKFAVAIMDFERMVNQVADSEAFKVAGQRIDAAIEKLEKAEGGIIGSSAGTGTPAVEGISKSPAVSIESDDSVIEDLMEKEEIPDRLKGFVRKYFSRNHDNGRNRK